MRTPLTLSIKMLLGSRIAEIFEMNQMLLPQDERAADMRGCGIQQGSFSCTLPVNHKGQHIAHNLIGNIMGRWDF